MNERHFPLFALLIFGDDRTDDVVDSLDSEQKCVLFLLTTISKILTIACSFQLYFPPFCGAHEIFRSRLLSSSRGSYSCDCPLIRRVVWYPPPPLLGVGCGKKIIARCGLPAGRKCRCSRAFRTRTPIFVWRSRGLHPPVRTDYSK